MTSIELSAGVGYCMFVALASIFVLIWLQASRLARNAQALTRPSLAHAHAHTTVLRGGGAQEI